MNLPAWSSKSVWKVAKVRELAQWFTLPVAALGHEISEFIVIGSSLRLLRA